jgi:hypothetical protein
MIPSDTRSATRAAAATEAGLGGGAMGAMGPDDPLYVPEEDDDPSS